MINSSRNLDPDRLSLIDTDLVLAQDDNFNYAQAIPLLKTDKMGVLMPKVRKLSARNVAALCLDFSPLAQTNPLAQIPGNLKLEKT